MVLSPELEKKLYESNEFKLYESDEFKLFDWEQYINNYQDLQKANINNKETAWYHWITYGQYENRKYLDRWNIIINYQYNPYLFLTKNEYGMYEATQFFSQSFQNQITNYFKERNEDE
jgi:hypothetical protein